jgi:hypothetical protein
MSIVGAMQRFCRERLFLPGHILSARQQGAALSLKFREDRA